MKKACLSTIYLALFGLAGCATFSNKVYSSVCAREGFVKGSPEMANCMEGKRLADQRDAQDTIAGAFLVGAAVNGASSGQSMPQKSLRQAPLVGQSVNGYQHLCQYKTDVQIVTVQIGAGTCPPYYAY